MNEIKFLKEGTQLLSEDGDLLISGYGTGLESKVYVNYEKF